MLAFQVLIFQPSLTPLDGMVYLTTIDLEGASTLQYYIKASDGTNEAETNVYSVEVTGTQTQPKDGTNADDGNWVTLHPAILVIILFALALSVIFNLTNGRRLKKMKKRRVKKKRKGK